MGLVHGLEAQLRASYEGKAASDMCKTHVQVRQLSSCQPCLTSTVKGCIQPCLHQALSFSIVYTCCQWLLLVVRAADFV
jgi:hypothetical protein